MTSYIKIFKILKLESKDNTRQTLHTKFYASGVKTSELGEGGVKYATQVQHVFKTPGKIGLINLPLMVTHENCRSEDAHS